MHRRPPAHLPKRSTTDRRGRRRGSTSTESDNDEESTKGARKVAAMAAVKAKMRQDLHAATTEVIDITDDTMNGPAVNPLSVLDVARRNRNAQDIDKGLAFQPATFRSSRADRKNKQVKDEVTAHDSAMFGRTGATSTEGPLLPNQRTIDDVSNAATVHALLTQHFGAAAVHLPDCVYDDRSRRRREWKEEWGRIRSEASAGYS